ncbi:MAG: ferritin family protein [Spirochaetales bacterium]|nr:ferritin family protein [Spirochaetales bacterium]
MSIIFNAEEIFDLAIQIEKNGAQFYKTISDSTGNPEIKKTLLQLAEMERKHEKTFQDLKDELITGTEQTVYDPYNELALYLKAFADGYVFDLIDPARSLTGQESETTVLKTAIQLEKDSIVLYLGMKELVPPDFGKEKIDKIIKEEMGHIRLLSVQLRSIE